MYKIINWSIMKIKNNLNVLITLLLTFICFQFRFFLKKKLFCLKHLVTTSSKKLLVDLVLVKC